MNPRTPATARDTRLGFMHSIRARVAVASLAKTNKGGPKSSLPPLPPPPPLKHRARTPPGQTNDDTCTNTRTFEKGDAVRDSRSDPQVTMRKGNARVCDGCAQNTHARKRPVRNTWTRVPQNFARTHSIQGQAKG